MKNSIRLKITAGYVLLVACLLIAVIFLMNQISTLQSSRNELLTQETKVQTLTSNLEKSVLNMNRSQRGYIITGDKAYLEPYNEAVKTWEDDLIRLKKNFSGQPLQKERLEAIDRHLQNWIDDAAEPTIRLKTKGDEEGIQNFYVKDQGQSEIDIITETFSELQNSEAKYLKDEMAHLDNRNENIIWFLVIFLLSCALIAAFVSSFISRSIIKTISYTTNAIKHISRNEGSLKTRIPRLTKDELGELAIATNELLDEIDHREWLQSNTSKIVLDYQGISSIRQLSNVFLTNIAKITQSSYGAFYVLDEQSSAKMSYTKQSVFANTASDLGRDSFLLGEGVIGQCALDRKSIHLKDMQDFRMLSTGLGELTPREIYIVPILFENQTIAILELGTIQRFSALQIQLMEQLTEQFGSSINSVLRRMEIVQLLNESRAMTEELQAQSEQLQAQSEQLQTQSDELQKQTTQLKKVNTELELRTVDAEEKTLELEAAKENLEKSTAELMQSSKYKSEFLANMSHELRTPLNSILILSEMMSENPNANLTDEDMEYASIIHQSGKDLLDLISDILDLSKIEAGKVELMFEDVHLQTLPSQLEANFSHFGKENDVAFHVELHDDVPDTFFTDAMRLQQILKNLLSNAFKFTKEGEVNVQIKKLYPNHEQQKVTDDWIQFDIKDTGIGISEDKQQHIFESFRQADGATVRKYGGTGLGLAICREFSTLLGGTIDVTSKEGEGSTFTLALPNLPNGLKTNDNESVSAVEETIEAVTPVEIREESSEASLFIGKHILIVDDDQRNIYSLEKVLNQHQFQIAYVENGFECIDYLTDHPEVDIVLMDIMMPELDGFDTMRIIRESLELDVPIIALTAKAMKSDREKCIAAGASDYLSKPFDINQLLSVLRVWLSEKEENHSWKNSSN